MAGNSNRKGAVRKSSKGKAASGSGGQRRKGLEGKGPTPKAEERPNHKAYRQARAQDRRQSARPKRKRDDAEWVAGRNPVVELLRAGVPVSKLYLAEGTERDDRLREIFRLTADLGVPVLETGRREIDKLTGVDTHQGVAVKIDPYDYASGEDLLAIAEQAGHPPLIVLLDGVTDPRNLGAVVRSAGAFGAHGVVIPERRAAHMTAAAWKTSAGAAAHVRVAKVTNLTRQIKAFQDAGLMVVGLDGGGDVSLPDLDLADGPLAVVVGGEGQGLSRLVAETCDAIVSIPIAPAVESLNAGVAAGVALYAISQAR